MTQKNYYEIINKTIQPSQTGSITQKKLLELIKLSKKEIKAWQDFKEQCDKMLEEKLKEKYEEKRKTIYL